MNQRLLLIPALLLLCVVCVGCIPPDGSLERVSPVSDKPRVGNVYLLRGWIGFFSKGIDTLGDKIDAAGIRATVYQDDQWSSLADTIIERYRAFPKHEPLILIGHSYGADDVVRISRKLDEAKIPVDLLITLDAVTPPDVPANVRHCWNIFQSNAVFDHLPFFRGIPLDPEEGAKVKIENVDLRSDRPDLVEPGLDHFNIEKQPKIHEEIIKQILSVCPPRFAAAAPHGELVRPQPVPVYSTPAPRTDPAERGD